jgi:predicted RNA-binding Zn-ribbon protein involved in translation (DUF1610 family)
MPYHTIFFALGQLDFCTGYSYFYYIMFFLVAGVQPRTRTVDDTPHRCPNCGRNSAKLKRIDHYFSLFFIPLFPVKRGDEILLCKNCGHASSPEGKTYFVGPGALGESGRAGYTTGDSVKAAPEADEKTGRNAGQEVNGAEEVEAAVCPECGHAVEKRFSYCPYCGSRL